MSGQFVHHTNYETTFRRSDRVGVIVVLIINHIQLAMSGEQYLRNIRIRELHAIVDDATHRT